MKNPINPMHSGLALGGLLGVAHLAWSLLVASGQAQSFINFILQIHMIQASYTVLPFSLSLAAGLVIVTSIAGCVLGYVFGLLWNSVQKS